jgi:hypothetical protein
MMGRGIFKGVILAIPILVVSVTEAATPKPIWAQSVEEIAKRVNKVRAGDDLTPKKWPGGKKVAVSLSFQVDTDPVWMGFSRAI